VLPTPSGACQSVCVQWSVSVNSYHFSNDFTRYLFPISWISCRFFIWFSLQFQLVWNYPLHLDFRNWVHPQLLSDITRYVVGSQFVKTVTYLQRRRLRRTVMPNSAADRVNVGSLSRRRMSTTATFSATRYQPRREICSTAFPRLLESPGKALSSWKVLENDA